MGSEETNGLRLEQIDVDGAIRETAQEATTVLAENGDTRMDFFKKAGVAGGAVMSGGALLGALVPEVAGAAAKKNGNGRPPKSFGKGDMGILNYALTLEYLEAAFYNEASAQRVRDGADEDLRSSGSARTRTSTSRRSRRRSAARPSSSRSSTSGRRPATRREFLATSYALENTGVHAYHGQVFNIQSRAYLKVALTIATVEARHAGVVGLLALNSAHAISPDGAFDRGMKAKRILNTVRGTHFIQ